MSEARSCRRVNRHVLIGGQPAARVGDRAYCNAPPDVIVQGSATVLIGGQMAARLEDRTAHGGVIVAGDASVLIGDGADGDNDDLSGADALAQAGALMAAAADGKAFCAICR